jgi:hypothetical protein
LLSAFDISLRSLQAVALNSSNSFASVTHDLWALPTLLAIHYRSFLASIINLTISAILCFATQPNRCLALAGFPRLTAISVGRHNPLSLAHILPPIQPHQPKRNLNKLRQLITLPRRNHIIIRPLLLQHQVHRLYIVLCPTPIPLNINIPQIQLILRPCRNPHRTGLFCVTNRSGLNGES